MSKLLFAIPGDIASQTGGYRYDRRVMQELVALGFSIEHIELGDSYPNPSFEHQQQTSKILRGLSDSVPIVIDGLALGAIAPEVIADLKPALIGLVHHPLAHEGDLPEALREKLLDTERRNLSVAKHVVVPSKGISKLLISDYQVSESKITVVEPGVDRPEVVREVSQPPLILSVGSLIPRKGHDVLLQALSEIKDLAWRTEIVGAPRDIEHARELEELVQSLGLGDRVKFLDELPEQEVASRFSAASIFALATRFEGYGMVFAEAMVHGVPIVSCRAGAVPETIATGAGILVEPNDSAAFANALRALLEDSQLQLKLSAASKLAGQALPSWSESAARFATAINAATGKIAKN